MKIFFSYTLVANDIAILELDKLVVFSDKVYPACLANYNPEPGNGTVSGWGTLAFNANPVASTTLQKVSVPILKKDSCVGLYGSSYITQSMFCAGVKGVDACQGDSGGEEKFTSMLSNLRFT